jgi:hypothetical protein
VAEIVIGLASSHSPQLSTPVEVWAEHAARDRANPALLGTDGDVHTFGELIDLAPPDLAVELRRPALIAKHERMSAALGRLRTALAESEATVAVVIGNDHRELFGEDAMPAFAVYRAPTLVDVPLPAARWDPMPEDLRKGQWAYHGEEPEAYPVAVDLADHLLAGLMDAGFDPTQITGQVPGRIVGHAWTFPRRRLMGARALPMVPVHVNTMYPPNRPSPSRCYRLGCALADAVGSWPEPERVAVIATGGLSHFVVDEALDREVLAALHTDDERRLHALPPAKLVSGTSEILNWVIAGGMLRGMTMSTVDYVPAYRSEAGTGVGMGFALWT